MDKIFENIYFNPQHPGSFGGINKLYNYAKLVNNNITLQDVKNWLIKQNVYTLHKPARKYFSKNKIFVSHIDEQWECDLIDVKQYSRQNNGFNYILNVIDSFSKFLFSYPTKTKTAIEIISCFKKIFKERKPKKLRSDKGGEFDNNLFKKFCEKHHVIYFTTQNKTVKCAIIERANRTLKEKLHRYATKYGTRKYIDILPKVVESYNNSHNRSIKMAPVEVDYEDEPIIFETLYKMPNLIPTLDGLQKPNLKIGDTVRQKYDLSSLDKSYYPLWTDMVYNVNKVYNKINKPQYSLEIDGEQLKRRFYPEELQFVSVNRDSLWLIERILKHRTVNKQKQVLVKWKGYPSKFNQWIPLDQLKNL